MNTDCASLTVNLVASDIFSTFAQRVIEQMPGRWPPRTAGSASRYAARNSSKNLAKIPNHVNKSPE